MAGIDVAVIGGGPAGAAAAIRLAEAGLTVMVFERELPPRMRIGESVGPGVRAQLAALGLADHWNDPRHRPALERASVWADEQLDVVPAMIQQVRGAGRQLDRNTFDTALLDHARERGAARASTLVVRVEHTPSGWTLITRPGVLRTRWLVDASGSGSVARQLGLVRSPHDRSFGLIAFVEPRPDALIRLDASEAGRALLIEATPGGWWYSALLADGRLAAAFMTDAEGLAGGREAAWIRGRANALHTAARLLGFVEPSRTWVRPSSPRSLLGTMPDYLAIGDAILSCDPLAGQGIEHALDSAARGVAALIAVEAGDATAIEHYAAHQYEQFLEHLRIRQRIHAAVERFADQPFWQARSRLA